MIKERFSGFLGWRTRPRWENPRWDYGITPTGRTPEHSARQLHDECKTGGNQPANISMIYRRNSGPVPPGQEKAMPVNKAVPATSIRLRRVPGGPILGGSHGLGHRGAAKI